jgi:hypothetical protein
LTAVKDRSSFGDLPDGDAAATGESRQDVGHDRSDLAANVPEVRVMTHLHGGFVAGASDGNPTLGPNGFGYGGTQSVVYPNQGPRCRLRSSGSTTTPSERRA